MPPAPDEMPAWAIRLEAKVDVALSQQGARLDRHDEIRDDHEERIRVLEARRTVAPWQVWTAVIGAIPVIVGIEALILTAMTQ